MKFLSNESVTKHKTYLNELKLKSYPEIANKSIATVYRSPLSRRQKEYAFALLSEIKLHEIYFHSFSDVFTPCPFVVNSFGSEANFLYEVAALATDKKTGFIVITCDKQRGVDFFLDEGFTSPDFYENAILAVDLWEHAYYDDYGFDRKKYLTRALSCLDFNKINVFLEKT